MSKRRKAGSTQQTTLVHTIVDEMLNWNKTFSYGTLRAVRHYLGFTDILEYVRSLKGGGPSRAWTLSSRL